MIYRNRLRSLPVLAVVTPLGVLTKFYAGPGAHWVESYLGGVLYVVFFVVLALVIKPDWPVRATAFYVFLGTSALEVLQLWHPPWLEAIRASFLGHALLGNTFSFWDFPHYALGAVVGSLLGSWITRGSISTRSEVA